MQRFILNPVYWLVPILLGTTLIALSLSWNWRVLDRHSEEIAAERARFVFKMIESVRLWNARHGGVYALVTDETQPNPYLVADERDISTLSGKRLTLINPAYMTRQLTSVVEELTDIQVHITSLKPINPANAADRWETEALIAFESGLRERQGFIGQGGEVVYRYMAPLITQQACLQCHEHQGYAVGDIRGGVGVSFKADSLLAPQNEQRRNIGITHFFIWLLLSAVLLSSLSRLRTQMLALRAAKEEQEARVEERTAELRQQVLDREQAEEELRLLIDSSGEGIFGIDREGRITFSNPVSLRLLGYGDVDQLIGKSAYETVFHQQPNRKRRGNGTGNGLWIALHERRAVHSEEEFFWRADGSPFRVEFRSHPLISNGRVQGAVVTFSDITERKALEEKIWYQAHYDTLTNLPNRSLFDDRLRQTILKAQRNSECFALLFLDLDRFKAVNDTAGHEAGDLLLQEVARRLTDCVRSSDTIARMGGDEFNIILPGIESREAVVIFANKILDRLQEPFPIAGTLHSISVSIGIACYPEDGTDEMALQGNADHAMYRAKREGCNGFRFHQDNRQPEGVSE